MAFIEKMALIFERIKRDEDSSKLTPTLTETIAMAMQRAEAGRGIKKAQMMSIEKVAVITFQITFDNVSDCWSTRRKLHTGKERLQTC